MNVCCKCLSNLIDHVCHSLVQFLYAGLAFPSSSKRMKATAGQSSRGHMRKEKVHSHLFLTKDHQKNFSMVKNRKLLMERKVTLLSHEIPDFQNEIMERHWDNLATYPAPANIELVREFYANARIFSKDAEPFLSYVRGKRIPFDADTINTFLNIEWRGGNQPCQYAQFLAEDIDYEEIEGTLCIPGGSFQRNRQGKPLHIQRFLLTPLSKFWMAIIHANISPCSHTSDVTTNRAIILYCILTSRSINLGKLIANEISLCAHAVHVALGHPSLITHLCQLAGVDISTPPLERPRKAIDISYYFQYCLLDEDGVIIPPPQPPRIHHRPQPVRPPTDPYQMMEMKMALLDAKLEALHRSNLAQAEMMRQIYFASSSPDFMSLEEYAARVAWPGD